MDSRPATTMRRAAVAAALALASCGAFANESFGSEFSHFVAGAGIASGVTLVADHYGAENRGWIGFGTASGVSFVLEAVQVAANGREQLRPSAIDFASNLLGAALGAWITDRALVAPTLTHTPDGHHGVGVAVNLSF